MGSEATSRAVIAKALGFFWIVDGLLQLQPKMFGTDFVTNVLVPSLNGQPDFMHVIVAFGITAWSMYPVFWNSAVTLLQVGIGLLLFFPISDWKFKTGLYVSILWGAVVWLCGEGAGQLLTGSASLYTGAPGAIFIYLLIAVLLLFGEKIRVSLYPRLCAWILMLGSFLQLQTVFWTSEGVQGLVTAATTESILVLKTFPVFLSGIVGAYPAPANSLLLCIPLLIGLLILGKPNRLTGSIAALFLFLVWWIGQDFGMLSTLFSGTSTDPNTAPLIALLLVPLFVRQTPGNNPF